MFIIWGFGKRTIRNFGALFKDNCPNCHNEIYWNLYSITTWFTLFFIPVIPYNIKRMLGCPICGSGKVLNEAQFQNFQILLNLNKDYSNGKLTPEEYKQKMAEFNSKF